MSFIIDSHDVFVYYNLLSEKKRLSTITASLSFSKSKKTRRSSIRHKELIRSYLCPSFFKAYIHMQSEIVV